MSFRDNLGRRLDMARSRTRLWKGIFFGFLVLLLVANAFILPHHPHVNQEHIPGFWAVFSILGAAVLILLAKGILAHVIGVAEDFYVRRK
jgi:cadmium resistance protein CadD (predicted permease)